MFANPFQHFSVNTGGFSMKENASYDPVSVVSQQLHNNNEYMEESEYEL